MKNTNKMVGLVVSLVACGVSFGWNGPICYPDITQQFTLTVETWAGEKPGDIAVTIDDGDEVQLVSVGASEAYDNAHKIILKHVKGDQGIAGVKLTTKSGSEGYTYEFEFRDGTCNGAIIERSLL